MNRKYVGTKHNATQLGTLATALSAQLSVQHIHRWKREEENKNQRWSKKKKSQKWKFAVHNEIAIVFSAGSS